MAIVEHRDLEPVRAVPDVRTVLVGVDHSDDALRALAPAGWLARHLGARVELVSAAPAEQATERSAWLDGLSPGTPISGRRVIISDDAVDALTAAVGYGDRVLGCFATRARRSAPVLGSVVSRLLDDSCWPTVLVGPRAHEPRRHGPVVVAVDGHGEDDELVHEAFRWAGALDTTVLLVTVAEPALPSVHGHTHRARGPEDPERYLQDLRASTPGAEAAWTDVEYDPISVEDGLVPLLQRMAPSLVVAGHRHHGPIRRLVAGDHAASIVRESPAPVVVVPLGLRR